MKEGVPGRDAFDLSAVALELYIRAYVACACEVQLESVAPQMDLELAGLSSANLVSLADELQERLQLELSPQFLLEAPSIRQLAADLAALAARQRSRPN